MGSAVYHEDIVELKWNKGKQSNATKAIELNSNFKSNQFHVSKYIKDECADADPFNKANFSCLNGYLRFVTESGIISKN